MGPEAYIAETKWRSLWQAWNQPRAQLLIHSLCILWTIPWIHVRTLLWACFNSRACRLRYTNEPAVIHQIISTNCSNNCLSSSLDLVWSPVKFETLYLWMGLVHLEHLNLSPKVQAVENCKLSEDHRRLNISRITSYVFWNDEVDCSHHSWMAVISPRRRMLCQLQSSGQTPNHVRGWRGYSIPSVFSYDDVPQRA